MKLDMLIVGVGGQGTLLASKILGNYATAIGKDCKLSEVHGMSQRGGSVVTYVRIGDKVHSPLIDRKCADVILAFEELEALRWAEYIRDGGTVIVNKQNIPVKDYPTDICKRLKKYNAKILYIDALSIAKQLLNLRTVNIAVLGYFAAVQKLNKAQFIAALKTSVKPETHEINLRAFEEGYARGQE